MDGYTIYCTVEQTKKAIKLGAPIDPTCYGDGFVKQAFLDNPDSPVGKSYYDIPTAEQMIGFILESGRGYSTDLSELIREQGYKQGCLTFINNCLK